MNIEREKLLDDLEAGTVYKCCFISQDMPKSAAFVPYFHICMAYGIEILVSDCLPDGKVVFAKQFKKQKYKEQE